MRATSPCSDGIEVLLNLDTHPIPWKINNYQPSKQRQCIQASTTTSHIGRLSGIYKALLDFKQ